MLGFALAFIALALVAPPGSAPGQASADPDLAELKATHDRTQAALIRLIKASQIIYEKLAATISNSTGQHREMLGQLEDSYRLTAFSIEGTVLSFKTMALTVDQLAGPTRR